MVTDFLASEPSNLLWRREVIRRQNAKPSRLAFAAADSAAIIHFPASESAAILCIQELEFVGSTSSSVNLHLHLRISHLPLSLAL